MNPEIILMMLVVGALAIYAVVGGADFGAGVWEFNTSLRSSDSEKRLLYQAIGPVWLTIWCIIGGLCVIAPPMAWLFYLFKTNKIDAGTLDTRIEIS